MRAVRAGWIWLMVGVAALVEAVRARCTPQDSGRVWVMKAVNDDWDGGAGDNPPPPPPPDPPGWSWSPPQRPGPRGGPRQASSYDAFWKGGTPTRLLTNMDVHFISLVPAGANQRQFLAKSATEGAVVVEREVSILKADTVRKMVYGIVYAPNEVDTQGDAMTAEEIEKAAYGFMKANRSGQVDSDHSMVAGDGAVVESWLIRKGDVLFPEETEGAWAVGIKVTDEATWERVAKGELAGLSMAGLATPQEVPGAEAAVEKDAEGLAQAFVRKVRSMMGIDASERERVGASQVEGIGTAGGVVELRKRAVPAGEPAEVAKGSFRENLFKNQLWRVTEALSDAIKECLRDETVTDKLGAVKTVLAEFEAWLTEQLGAVTQPVAKSADAATADVETLREQIAKQQQQIDALMAQTGGRQSVPGDRVDVEKGGKGYKGLRIGI